jgi:signal transduction histidine kinase/ActR/RegA family two-component response regulator
MKIELQAGPIWHRLKAFTGSQRQWLLLCCLLGAAGNALLFYFVPQPGYDHAANLLAVACFLVLALFLPNPALYTLLSNLGVLTAIALVVYFTAYTGGINSPAMVWMTIMPVAALVLLGRRWAMWWACIIMLTIFMQFLAVTQGLISGEVNQSPQTIVRALLDKILVILTLMLVVHSYERVRRRQIQKVEQSNAELEAAHQALLQAQSHKDEFMASVGHELRTPMNAILGLNGVLQSELGDQPDNVEIAEHIRLSTEQLLSLVNEILDFSQLEAGRLTLLEKPLELAPFFHRLMQPFAVRAQEKSLTLQLQIDPQLPAWILADEQRLLQIVSNLLDNAIKFTHQGQVDIRLTALQGKIRVEVQDTGRGIPLERQQQVFNRFEHAGVQTKLAYGGTGLGLAICERLVSLQQGQIGVQSAQGQGALFWFELPLEAVPPPAGACVAVPTQPAPQVLRFLLVDDNAVNIMVAQLLLTKCWPLAHVVAAHSGEEALQVLGTESFDVVLMDMIMPSLDGLQTTHFMRTHMRPELAQIIVIGLTANTNALDRERCMQAGMNAVLSKPMNIQQVKDMVEGLFASAQAPQP